MWCLSPWEEGQPQHEGWQENPCCSPEHQLSCRNGYRYSKPSDTKPDRGVTEPCLRNFCSANMRMEHGGTSPLCFLLWTIMKKTTNPYQILDGNFNSTSQGEIPPRFPSHHSGSFFLQQQTTRKKAVPHFLYLIALADPAILYQQQTYNLWLNSSNRMYYIPF